MKPAKKVLIIFGVVIVAVIIAAYFLVSNIDSIVKGAIEKYGSRAAGTDVSVRSVKIGLREGTGSISDIRIKNPPGFSSPAAMALGDVSVDIDTGTVTGNPVVIDRLSITAPHVTYEINSSGKANLNQIRDNLKSYAGAAPAEKKAGNGKRLLIRRLVVEGAGVDVLIAALPDKDLSASIPRIELSNVGGEGGASPGEIAVQVLTPILNRAAQAAARQGAERYIGKSEEEVKSMLKEKAGEKLGTSGEEAVKKLLGK